MYVDIFLMQYKIAKLGVAGPLAPLLISYINMIVVCPSITEGQWKQFDLETQGTVSLALD